MSSLNGFDTEPPVQLLWHAGGVAWHACGGTDQDILRCHICPHLCARVQHPSRRYDVPAGLLMAASLLFCHLSPAAGRMGRMGCFQFNRVLMHTTTSCDGGELWSGEGRSLRCAHVHRSSWVLGKEGACGCASSTSAEPVGRATTKCALAGVLMMLDVQLVLQCKCTCMCPFTQDVACSRMEVGYRLLATCSAPPRRLETML